jgi:hypothetical protein
MSVDEMLCRWAEGKYGLTNVVRVEFVYDEGFPGTDVTPADMPSMDVAVTTADGERKRMWEDLAYAPELIREILEVAEQMGRIRVAE